MKLKTLLFSALTVFFATNVNAQIKKGSIFLGGSINFASEKTDPPGAPGFQTQKQNTFGVSPAVGKAVKDNLIVGIEANFFTREYYGSGPDFSGNEKMAGGAFFARKYAPLGKNFYLFGHGSLGAGWQKTSYRNGGTSGKNEGYNIGLNFYPGLAYSVTSRLQLEAAMPSFLYASYTNLDPGNGIHKRTFSAGTAFSNFSGINIGVRILLNKAGN